MHLFNFFQRKSIQFEKKCLIDCPLYLRDKFRDIPDELFKKFRIQESDFTWTRQIISATGATKFEIKYYGNLQKNLIYPTHKLPAMVLLIEPDSKEEILVFDGAKHGYNAIWVDTFPHEVQLRSCNNRYEKNGERLFEIIVLTRFIPHLKEELEEDLKINGYLRNAKNEKIELETYLNAFGSIEIFAFGQSKEKIQILEVETS